MKTRAGPPSGGKGTAEARPAPTNAQVAAVLREMSLFLEMERVPFKPRAYEKAAWAIDALDRPVAAIVAEGGIEALEDIPAVGAGIAGRIVEILKTGKLRELEAEHRKMPVDVSELTSIEGLGALKARALFEAIGVRTVDELERAARGGRIRRVKGFGERSEEKILRGIEFYRLAGGRRLLGVVLPLALEVEARLAKLPGVARAAAAGSIRRRKETIGDVDFVVAADDPGPVMSFFASMPEVEHVYAHGPTKTLVRLSNGMDADIRVVPTASWGAALLYFTGSKNHNVALRRVAQGRELKLNEYGLFRGEKSIAGREEEDVYRALDLPWIPPELREDEGELEAARRGALPTLLSAGDLRGDLQVHTSWTDGTASLEEIVEEAKRMGLEYVAITDHTRDLAITRGAEEAKLSSQVEAIRALQRKVSGIRILTGAEVSIHPDGTLDVSDDALAGLDVVGAAIHAEFDQPRAEATRRVIRAMENPHVDALFHPTARLIGRRKAVDLDLDAVIAAAKRTGTALELDAQPERLDLDAPHVRKAIASGVALLVNSDAHSLGELRFAREFGVAEARRGWARPKDVLNTMPVDRALAALKGKRPGA